jgi:hypothetical protein
LEFPKAKTLHIACMSVPRLRVLNVDLRVLPMRTRIPFRYGIATLTHVPHLFVQAAVEVDGKVHQGFTSEGLPPKWFTKNPRSSNEQDLADMLAVIQNAVRLGSHLSASPVTFYAWWHAMHQEQGQWAFKLGHPPLLWNFGISMIERPVVEAMCKHAGVPAHEFIRSGALGVNWGDIHPGLDDHTEKDFLPAAPLGSVQVRHTIGLADPILISDIPAGERLHDGLPQALEECIPAYGLHYFKVKAGGNLDADLPRLASITKTLLEKCGDTFCVTLDGNESFTELGAFRAFYEKLRAAPAIKPLLVRLLWVEQPIHRDKALSDSVGRELQDWPDAPAMIIDESDGDVGDAHRALKLGYSGTSHKNCKGILKGLVNAALVHHHRRLRPKRTFILSAEDLCIAGPVTLMQDLAMHALLGTTHVERNGHHYFRGLTPYPPEMGVLTARAHPDMYVTNGDGLTSLKITDGALSLQTVNEAPFGYGVEPDLSVFPTLKDWIMRGGMQALVG